MAKQIKIMNKKEKENVLLQKYFKKLGPQIIANHQFGRPIPTEKNVHQLYPMAVTLGDFYLIGRLQKIMKILDEKSFNK